MSQKPSTAPVEVFLSHSSRNGNFARRLADALAAHGIQTFVSKQRIRGAQQWHDEIGAALKRCDWFVVVLSPPAVSSTWVKHELMYALQSDRYRGRIVPVLYKTCDADSLSWTLTALQWTDFSRDFNAGCRDLLAIWRMSYSQS